MGDLALAFAGWMEPAGFWTGRVLLLAGALLSIVGAVGVLRFPDFYTRMHAASVTETSSLALMILGMMCLAGWSMVSLKLLLVWLFMTVTSPAAAHALAHAALTDGLDPLVGEWRPGAGGKRASRRPAGDGAGS